MPIMPASRRLSRSFLLRRLSRAFLLRRLSRAFLLRRLSRGCSRARPSVLQPSQIYAHRHCNHRRWPIRLRMDWQAIRIRACTDRCAFVPVQPNTLRRVRAVGAITPVGTIHPVHCSADVIDVQLLLCLQAHATVRLNGAVGTHDVADGHAR